jgi:Tol biopolymer transport system component
VQVSQVLDWGIEAMPSPEPGGSLVAYQTNRVTNDPIRFTLRVLSLADGGVRQLDAQGSSPRWSPLGDRIAFLDRQGELHTMKPDGSDDRAIGRITAQPGFSWSPDGKWLLIVGRSGLAIVNVATGDVLPLALRGPGGTSLYQPAWRP